jgi:membrane-bound serine protease (ClpP class)
MKQIKIVGILLLALTTSVGAQGNAVYRIPVTGTIENGLAPYISRVLTTAANNSAQLVVLDIDTPGGRIDAAERITDAVRNSPVPVVAWIHPRAWSAGAMIALSAGKIYISPGGAVGAATPVDGSGTKASEKMVSAMRAEFRALAEAGGRDPSIAEAMVDESLDLPGLAPAGKLLSLTTGQALEVGFADAEVGSLEELLALEGATGAEVITLGTNWAEALVRFITNPVVAPLLLSLGMLGLVFEIKAGAFGIGGLLSIGSLSLFFGSSFLIGLAGLEEVLLLGVGLIAVGVEVFIIPGFGVAGLLGTGLIGGAVVLALLGSAPTGGDVVTALGILGAALVISAAVFFAWLRHLPNSNRWSGLLLKKSIGNDEGFVSAEVRNDLIGKTATALTDLRPSGTAEIGEERVDVVTEGEFLPAGATLQVLRAEGYRHVVRAARNISPAEQG